MEHDIAHILFLLLVCLPAFLSAESENPTGILRRSLHRSALSHTDHYAMPTNGELCASEPARQVAAPKKNVWLGLTANEATEVTEWLYKQKDLNLTAVKEVKPGDNRIHLVELMIPNKTNALEYIENGAKEPNRYAHALIAHRSSPEPHYQNILVGPLPVKSGVTKWEPLTYPYTKKSGTIRDLESKSEAIYGNWTESVAMSVKDITDDLWNTTKLNIGGIDPFWQDDGITSWFGYYSVPDSFFDTGTLLPLGLYFRLNVTGRDSTQWRMLGWLYDDVFYNTTEDFRTAYWAGLPPLPPVPQTEPLTPNQQGPTLPLDNIYPPTNVAPGGSRFFVDKEEKYVKWMDFEFYIAFTRETAMRLYEIKYKGQRILYELGMQEALAHYAGNDPVQSSTSYLDSLYNFGWNAYSLIDGYDCPTYSTYLDSSYFADDVTHTRPRTICLFEMNSGFPIARHWGYEYVSATKNVYLVLRSVSTLGNYDYQFNYEFYYDGSIRVEVRASGIIQAAYWAKNHEYGYKIHDALSGSMHDHVLNFKADFDILGTQNTMQTVENIPVSEIYSWSGGKRRNTMKLKRGLIKSEDESKLFWGPNSAIQYKIVNLDKPNKYGEVPGYRIFPSAGAIHLTVQNSSNIGLAAQWANHDLFVTKQKDTEPRSADPHNSQDVYDPLINFDNFFDGENLTQTDIVTWFNLGMHHVPHTGDLPNTIFTTAHSGVTIMPLNYLLKDPSTETVNRVRIMFRGQGYTPTEIVTFGQEQGSCKVNFTSSKAANTLW